MGSLSLNVEIEGSMKPRKKRSSALKTIISGSTTSIAAESQDDEEVW